MEDITTKKPDFFILGTGKNYSVENFLDKTFKQLGLSYKKHLKIDKKLISPLRRLV